MDQQFLLLWDTIENKKKNQKKCVCFWNLFQPFDDDKITNSFDPYVMNFTVPIQSMNINYQHSTSVYLIYKIHDIVRFNIYKVHQEYKI